VRVTLVGVAESNGKLEAEVARISSALKKLAVEQAEHRRETRQRIEALAEGVATQFAAVDSQFDIVLRGIDAIRADHATLTNAVLRVVDELGVAKSHEERIKRLEGSRGEH